MEKCFDQLIFGNCTWRNLCRSCKNVQTNIQLNLESQEYVPKKKKVDVSEKLVKLNLDAEEYVPKFLNNNFQDEEEDLEVMMNDMIEEPDIEEEADIDEWIPKYENCECCKGFIRKCKGLACEHLDYCYCKIKDDIETGN
jgi:hypothetical protein